ncbi:MAG: hypothetical protein AMXMBFR48_25970 [Ignavibacteriales bacterium]
MNEVNKHIKRINIAGYVVATWSVLITFLSFLALEKEFIEISGTLFVLGLIEIVVLFILSAGVTLKHYKFLWVILFILTVDTIGALIVSVSGNIAIFLRVLVISFVLNGLRSAILLKDPSHFNQNKKFSHSDDAKNTSSKQGYYKKSKSAHEEKQKKDFNSIEDYYLYILNVQRYSSGEEIKRAYKKLIKNSHPDRFEHLGKEFRDIAEAKTKLINEAFEYFKKKFKLN